MHNAARIISKLPALAILQIGLGIVFIFFGIAKFKTYEALGVADLIANHPMLGLGPDLIGAKAFGALLGITELVTAALLLFGLASPRLGMFGGLLGALAFTLTLTLLFTNVIWFDGAFGFLNTVGQFLAKDFGLLAACLAVASLNAKKLI